MQCKYCKAVKQATNNENMRQEKKDSVKAFINQITK